MINKNIVLGLAGLLSLGLGACGKKGEGGTAKVAFANSAAALTEMMQSPLQDPMQAFTTTEAATEFKMKMIAVYLAEGVDPVTQNNTGVNAIIYMNPDCHDNIGSCNISSPDTSGATYSNIVSTFFNFSQSSAAVNAEINAQGRGLDAATYNYVRMEFCKYGAPSSDPNVKWSSANAPGEHSFAVSSCGVTAQLAAPITVAKGDSVTVTLTYDLSALVTNRGPGQGSNTWCAAGTGGDYFCANVPTFVPSAAKD